MSTAQDRPPPRLHRSFGLLQATAMNMSNMVGVGPFLTIPLILAAMVGPQAMLGWIVGAVLAICDGMVWAELASAIPTSGGSFAYLKVAFAKTRFGRLLPFLFIWQFILSGPLELASGTIGFSQYANYIMPMTQLQQQLLAVGVMVLIVAVLYRRIESVGRLMVVLWAGMILTLAAVVVPGLWHFNAAVAFDFSPGAFSHSKDFAFGLGAATSIAMYDLFGYYGVCYIGDEVRDPSRTIPRSILISVVAVAAIYTAMNLSIISVVPWREAMKSNHIVSDFAERLFGHGAALTMTVLICWTAFTSVYALLLGYSRIPYAAARDGYFFSAFGQLHPHGDFPHVSLLVLGAVAAGASFFPLDAVISALICTRIMAQFVAQIAAVIVLRRRGLTGSFRMALYPLPCAVALLGWFFLFATSGLPYIAGGLGSLAAGLVAYFAWSRLHPQKDETADIAGPQEGT